MLKINKAEESPGVGFTESADWVVAAIFVKLETYKS